jgi:hypothetical protein
VHFAAQPLRVCAARCGLSSFSAQLFSSVHRLRPLLQPFRLVSTCLAVVDGLLVGTMR